MKNILKKFKIPTNFQNLRSLKEHAKETKDEIVDLKPALIVIHKLLPRKIRRKIGKIY